MPRSTETARNCATAAAFRRFTKDFKLEKSQLRLVSREMCAYIRIFLQFSRKRAAEAAPTDSRVAGLINPQATHYTLEPQISCCY